ncbi:MAG: hypothetical protein EGP73_09280 [Alistipes indistinctus]|nr:hypothetical protein [Alistipes indistinctus]
MPESRIEFRFAGDGPLFAVFPATPPYYFPILMLFAVRGYISRPSFRRDPALFPHCSVWKGLTFRFGMLER